LPKNAPYLPPYIHVSELPTNDLKAQLSDTYRNKKIEQLTLKVRSVMNLDNGGSVIASSRMD
jgi:hypothetical protein